jgi:PilZ domain
VSDQAAPRSQSDQPQDSSSLGKLIHLALPVRLIHTQNGQRSAPEISCTYDIHAHGARLRSNHDVKVGDLITVERGRLKTACQVIWTGDPDSALRGQFTVQCLEGSKIPWEEELSKMEEQYLPVILAGSNQTPVADAFGRRTQNRRRRPRFAVKGGAEVTQIGGETRLEGRLEEISEQGCLISANDLLIAPGTSLRLVLNMCDVVVALRGQVRHTSESRTMGVEFQEIRQGDRPLLDYVLNRLKKHRTEDFADLEVITDSLEAAG